MSSKIKKQADNIERIITLPPKKSKRDSYFEIENFGTLGREIRISPKSNITVNKPGYKIEFFTETINILIGIGRDHTADLIMSKDAWEALKAGIEISITTTKQFKKSFL